MTRITLRRINAALAAAGFAEELVRGANGAFYFLRGHAHRWPSTEVPVFRLDALTIEQWVEAARELREEAIRRGHFRGERLELTCLKGIHETVDLSGRCHDCGARLRVPGATLVQAVARGLKFVTVEADPGQGGAR